MDPRRAGGGGTPVAYNLTELKPAQGASGLRLYLSPEALFSARLAAQTVVEIEVESCTGVYVAEVWPLAKLTRLDAALSPPPIGSFPVGAAIRVRRTVTAACSVPCAAVTFEIFSIGASTRAPREDGGEARGSVRKTPKARTPAVMSPAMRQATPPVMSPAMRQSTPAASSTPGTATRGGRDPLLQRVSLSLAEALVDGENLQSRALFERRMLAQLCGWRPVAGNEITLAVLSTTLRLRVSRVTSPGPGEHGPIGPDTSLTLRTPDEVDSPELSGVDRRRAAALQAVDSLGAAARGAAERALDSGLAMAPVMFESVGGYAAEIAALRDLVLVPLANPALFAQVGLQPPRGVLLHGPPGTGKTLLARAVAAETGGVLLVVNGAEMVSEFLGDSESAMAGIFGAARAVAPAVIFLDEFDAIAAGRSVGNSLSTQTASSSRLIHALLEQIDALQGHQVVVVAGTNRVETLDEALRRPGRFDREIEIGVPSPSDRRAILEAKLRGIRHSLSVEEIHAIADHTHGFVGADLASLCSEAAFAALRRLVRGDAEAASTAVSLADFRAAQTLVRPSALREVALEIPDVKWSDIGGLEDVKMRLREVVELPFQRAEELQRLAVKAPQGILLYGPPGCSKTMLARAVANEAKLNFLSVKGSELFSKYVGESEKGVQRLFRRARLASPCVIFLDEVDGLASSRSSGSRGGASVGERVVSQLLQEMDGLEERPGVIVIGATNRLDAVDAALLRPGRFDRLVHVPLPDAATRRAIFEVHCRKLPLDGDVDLELLAATTEGYTGADIGNLCREAGLCAMEEDMEADLIAARHFDRAGLASD